MTLRGTDGVRPFSFDGRISGGDTESTSSLAVRASRARSSDTLKLTASTISLLDFICRVCPKSMPTRFN
jgi:hypothetical protein